VRPGAPNIHSVALAEQNFHTFDTCRFANIASSFFLRFSSFLDGEHYMHNDDVMVGRLLTRRELVALLGMSSVAAMAEPLAGQAPGTAMPGCVVQPEQTEGPYFVDKMLNRQDVRLDPVTKATQAGLPLRLTFNVSQITRGKCAPLSGAQVDLWQCDVSGVYSGVKDPNFNTVGQHFLRGYQLTDAKGTASFQTIYPGWYPGRAVHVHFKIRTTPAAATGHEFTSQLYFDEAFTDRVFSREPYSKRSGQRVKNEGDGIFQKENGKQLILPVTESKDGYAGTFSLALNMGKPASKG
jgi:protocatechuate 3,4-dioxygenase beta subunit